MFSEVDFTVYLACVLIGVTLAAVYAYYNKSVLGKLVRRLLEEGCDSEARGMTLIELGMEKSSLVRFALRPSSSLSRVVKTEAEYTGNVRIGGKRSECYDFTSARFYIPIEFEEKASRTYDSQGTTVLSVALTAIVFFFVLTVCYFALPMFIDFSNTMIKTFYEQRDDGIIKVTGSEGYDFSDIIDQNESDAEKAAAKNSQ